MSKEIIIGIVIVLLLVSFFVYGCSGYKRLLDQVPDVEFESFSYHRGGNVTSATITATGAKKEGDALVIEDLHITADYGPLVNFDVQLRGYRRALTPDAESDPASPSAMPEQQKEE